MDPFTLALATFGIQKLRGKSTRTALKSAAIIGGGAYGLGKLGGVTAFQGSPFSSLGFGQKAAMAPKGDLGSSFLNKANMPEGTVIGVDKFDNIVRSQSGLSKVLSSIGLGGKGTKMGNIGKLATLGAVSTFLTKTLGMPPEQAEAELARDPSGYLERYYRNLNPPTADTNSEEYEAQVRDFVARNTSEYAVGGRVGFAEGPVLPPDPTQPVNPFGPKPGDFGIEEDIPIKMASDDTNERVLEALFEKYLEMGLSPKDAAEKAREEFERMSMRGIEETRKIAAIGGKMDTASENAMQAAGIEGLPLRQNPKGVKELDLRETGGFIQPVGIKEKEDDIPAMLSNNEFVFTADAVRGMGDGDVDLGAQRMYDMMKTLEAGGRV